MKDRDLVRWENPFGLWRRFANDMERLFDLFPDRFFLAEPREALGWMPKVDVFEKEGTLIVRADLPGLTKKDVQVEVTSDTLTIKGERKTEFEEKREGVHRQERAYGAFYRALPLPEHIKPEDVKATFANGVLEVKIPIAPTKKLPKPHHVEVVEPAAEKAKSAA